MTVIHLPLAYSKILIVLNGFFDFPRDFSFQQFEKIIVADGAWNKVKKQSWVEKVTAIMGDGDSIIDKPKQFITMSDQNFTDFEKIVQYLLDKGIGGADVVCASGGEMDHFLGNLSVAKKYASRFNLRFFDAQQCYFYIDQSCQLYGVLDKTISLYPFPKMTVSSRGLLYEMQDLALDLQYQQGLRNMATSDVVDLEITGSGWLFLRE